MVFTVTGTLLTLVIWWWCLDPARRLHDRDVREWLSCTHLLPFPWLRSSSHSRPREILNYIPISIYSRKVSWFPPIAHSHWNGGLSRLHSADEDAVSWLTNYGKWHAYEKKKIETRRARVKNTLIVVHKEWFSLEWAHKIIHYCSMLVSQYTWMKWKWRARCMALCELLSVTSVYVVDDV